MDFIGHYLIALIVGLAVFGKQDWKKIAVFSVFALLPDFDFVFGLHRMLFHNIFFAIITGVLVFAVLKKIGEKKAAKYGFFAFLGVFSHLLLDLGKPGVAIFYPIIDKAIHFEFYLSVYFWQVIPHVEFGFSSLSEKTLGFCCEMERALLSDTTTVILLLLLLALTVQKIKENNGKE